jgi:hypothetical protein
MTANRPTNQDQTDDHFEEHLRGFRPVAPHALAIPRRRAPWTALAGAAVLLLAVGVSFLARHGRRATVQHPFISQSVTVGRLNAALRDNDETLNRLLDDASPNVLPRGQHGTVLYELGKE